MASKPDDDDDPDLAAGRAILSGTAPSGTAPATDDDPDLAAGKAILGATAKPSAGTKPTGAPYDVEHSWLGIPAIHNFAAGVTQGAQDVVATGANFANWVDQRVPALAWLDRHTIGDMGDATNALDTSRRAYEASPEGQSYTGGAGRVVGGIAATLPLAAGVGALAGAGSRLGAAALEEAAPWLSRVITGASDFVSGSAAAPQAGAVPNLLLRTGSLATQGGVLGGEYGALTSGGSDQPAGENILHQAELGAAFGPPAAVLAKVAGLGVKGAAGAYNYLSGRAPALEVERAMADARARVGAAEPPEAQAAAHNTAVAEGRAPQPPSGGAAGADVTSQAALDANALTRRQDIAGKVDALDKIISDRPNIGRADFNEYVEGNLPTQAEGLGDARLSSIQRQVEPGEQRFTSLRDAAVNNRIDHFERRAGTAPQLEAKERALADWDKETLEPVWAKKQPVDASNVISDVDTRLASPTAQIGPVEQALNEVRKRIFKRGTDELHDDPQMLYGARRHISYMLSRAGRKANPAYGDDDVMRELIGVRDEIDKAIEPGAPGFKAWLTGHAAEAQDIDRMDVLQSLRQQIIGANGDIQLSRLTGALKGLRTRMAMGGANPVHSLNLEDLEMLRDLNKDLLREGNKGLSMPIGSPTSHNREVLAEHGLAAVNALAQAGASRIPGASYLLEQTMGRTAAKNAARQKELWIRNLLQGPNLPPP